MTSALDTRPVEELMDNQTVSRRPGLADLAELGAEELTKRLSRVLPAADSGPVPVAAFNSSI
ncbi:FxSxx-COOH cyclophane-containing RiPP peptide [Kitasatospora hibisci]|uniref:FxSxx-COOH cyclophane-containing RiPP peptide n=1 Tax=Kitasatospora hibisci TaxID=3369522 RepID=UPI003754C366